MKYWTIMNWFEGAYVGVSISGGCVSGCGSGLASIVHSGQPEIYTCQI